MPPVEFKWQPVQHRRVHGLRMYTAIHNGNGVGLVTWSRMQRRWEAYSPHAALFDGKTPSRSYYPTRVAAQAQCERRYLAWLAHDAEYRLGLEA